jgi:FKBP-type peptidyl-prolyl cis-trans isomerase
METKLKMVCTLAAATVLVVGCSQLAEAPDGPKDGYKFSADASYAAGMEMGKQLAPLRVSINYAEFMKGFADAVAGKKSRLSEDAAEKLLNTEFGAAKKKADTANAADAKKFMDDNAKKNGIKTTASGLQYQVLKEGNGQHPSADSTVRVEYIGTLTNGTEFDRNRNDKPAEFRLTQVIPGWREGIALMNTGAHYKFYVPPKLAYGERSPTPAIPPNSVLIFDVKLVEIVPTTPAATPPSADAKPEKANK